MLLKCLIYLDWPGLCLGKVTLLPATQVFVTALFERDLAYKCSSLWGNIAGKTSCNLQCIAFNQRCHLYQLLPCNPTIKLLVPKSKSHRIAVAVYVGMCETLLWIAFQDGNEPFFQKRQWDHSFSSQHSAIITRHEDEVQSKVSTVSKKYQMKKFDGMLAKQNSSQKQYDSCVANLLS